MVSPYSYAGMKGKMDAFLNTMPDRQMEIAENIISVTCQYFHVKREDLFNRWRERRNVEARQMCMVLIREKTGMTLKNTAKIFNRDHTTCMHSIQTINDLCQTDDRIKEALDYLRTIL